MTAEHFLFELKNVFFQYASVASDADGAYAISNLSLSLSVGEHVAVAGSNGSGKSTFAKLLTGLVRPTSGTVDVLGQSLQSVKARGDLASYVGIVLQNPDFQSVATIVEEDVAFVLENLQRPYEEMHQRVEQALRTVDMWAHRQREVHHLSGGQRQRVAIAGVLAADPKCILFDEATSMLDAVGRREVQREMKRLTDAGHTVISITHRTDEMMAADRLLVFDHGVCTFDGMPQEAFTDARVQPVLSDIPASTMAASILTKYSISVPKSLTPGEAVNQLRQLSVCGQIIAEDCEQQLSQSCYISEQTSDVGGVRRENEASQMPVIDIHGLSHVYSKGTPTETSALHDVSFQVFPGEIVAVMGATGSGKSTLGLYLNGLYRAKRGMVHVFGMDAADRKHARELRRRVGMLFQKSEDQIFESLIGDEIAYGPFRFGANVDEAREAVRAAMEEVGLDFSWRDRSTRWLSGGERRRVAMASVLAQQPDMLVLDEPTLGLDPVGRKSLLSDLRRLRRDRQLTIVFVTHQVEEAASIADRVLLLDQGRLVLNEAPQALFSRASGIDGEGADFELPDIPQYAVNVCDVLQVRPPQPLPFTEDAFRAWFEETVRGFMRSPGGPDHG